ncbi:MAG TPA: M14 family zinc carboxypeptidase, partial [Longimicrobiales bacterium]
GTSEEGREMIAVAVASEALIARLDENRALLGKLADPRSIGMNDALAREIAAQAAPVYYITGAIHSPEAGAPSALMELAYRLAVDESPYVRDIRDHLVTLITPVVEVDGRDRMVDLFEWHKAHPRDTWPPLVFWGHYVAHDNNRDAMGMTLKLTQNVLATFVDWHAQLLHDLHESVPYLYDNTVGDGPYNAWLDPLVTNEWQMIGWNNVQEMTRFGMPGVFAHGTFDTWSPGYLMFIAPTHNGISRLYETFGNGGTAETVERTLSPRETERTWYRQNPPLPRVKWSLRDNNNYQQTGMLVSLKYFADNRVQFLENFWEKSKRSVLKATTEGPAAYVLPADERRPGAQAQLLAVLQKQRVEISRATEPFTVKLPARRARPASAPRDSAAADTTRRPPAAGADSAGGRGRGTQRAFPAGSWIIRMDQPFSRIADALLDYQFWSPQDPQKQPYDDTGWTFPEAFAVQALRVTDSTILRVPMERVSGEIRAPGGIVSDVAAAAGGMPGAGAAKAAPASSPSAPPAAASGISGSRSGSRSGSGVYAIPANGDDGLALLRYRLRSADIVAVEQPFEMAGRRFPRGTFLVRGVAAAELDRAARDAGVRVVALDSAPAAPTHPVRAARVAILHAWSGTQTEGWWRQAFDALGLPYAYISTQDVARDAELNARYDVILFPPVGGSVAGIVQGLATWRNALPWKKTPLTPNIGTWAQTEDVRPGLGLQGVANLQAFVARGGVLLGVENTAELATSFGLAAGVSLSQARRGSVAGSLLRTRLADDASPIAYGVPDSLAVYSDAGGSFGVSAFRSGGSGRRGGEGDATRATGRGTSDDPDVVQGRLPLDSAHMAVEQLRVQPWQYALPTDEQLRNPIEVIPPALRPRVVLRFADQRDLLVSGLLDGGGDVAQRAAVVDVPLEKGHVVLFATNPMWRGETIGSHALVLNTILHWDHLDAGRKVDTR